MNTQDYIGLNIVEAEKKAKTEGFRLRVTRKDGKWVPHTDDLQKDRLSVHVEDMEIIHCEIE